MGNENSLALSPALRLHVLQVTRFASDGQGDGAAADSAVFDRRIAALRGIHRRRKILTTPRAWDFRFDDVSNGSEENPKLESGNKSEGMENRENKNLRQQPIRFGFRASDFEFPKALA